MAPGFFLPLEQEVGRALAHRRARGVGGGPVIQQAARLGLVLAACLTVVTLALGPVLVSRLFGNSWLLFVGLVLSIGSYFATYLGRGVLAGRNRFRSYGLGVGVDGVIRVAGCAILATFGVHTAGPYGVLIGTPAFVAIVIAVRREHGLIEPGPPAPVSEVTAHLGYLVAGSVFAATLMNAGPIAVKLLARPAEHKLASHFFSGLLITRVPLFLFQAVQAALLPKLANLAGAGRLDEFRARFAKLMSAVTVVAAVAVVGAFLLGPFVVRTMFGPDFELPRSDLTLIAAASAIFMLAISCAQALIALQRHAKVAAGWLVGIVVLVVVIALGHALLLRVETGLVAGTAASTVFFAWTLRSTVRQGATLDPDALIEALHDLPVEP
jgi:O-antigen/teichoic acid export membrane protein